jgi:septum formation protein
MDFLNKLSTEFSLILGSESPRRKLLLSDTGLKFRTAPLSVVNEDYNKNMNVYDVANFLSKKKSEHYPAVLADDEILITADTVVICEGEILGKPKNHKEAFSMLSKLSEKTHEVMTSVTLRDTIHSTTFSETTKVTFRQLQHDEIEYYVTNYRPFDKAGSYGIQEWIGYIGIEKIEGCYYNVMGLPLNRLFITLKEFTNPRITLS